MPDGAVTEYCCSCVLQGRQECKEDTGMSFWYNTGKCVWHVKKQDGNCVVSENIHTPPTEGFLN